MRYHRNNKKPASQIPRVERHDNVITIHSMNNPASVYSFLRVLQKGIENGIKSFVIVCDDGTVYPDACVPIAGVIAFYKENYHISFSFKVEPNSYLEHCGFLNPFCSTVDEISKEAFPFDKLYRYSSDEQVAALSQAYVDSLSSLTICSPGVLDSLNWCLSEIMDNVLLHSKVDHGFVMAQYHRTRKYVSICVYDSGIGIYNSLRKSPHSPRKVTDAISLAIQEGVGDGKGQGNGLHGLYQIISENNGTLTITSGPASITWDNHGVMRKTTNLPRISSYFHATAVDYRLNLDTSIDFKRALDSIGRYEPFDIRIDSMLQDNDMIQYDVFSSSSGTATRESGERLRNDILNTITRTNKGIILDFAGVKLASSSFVDELIAKLIIDLGPVNFNQVIRIINLDETIKYLTDRSVFMRIHSEWSKKKRRRKGK